MTKKHRSGSQKRQRDVALSVRFTKAERNEIHAKAQAVGLTAGAYLRMLALDVPPPRSSRVPTQPRKDVAQLLGHLGKVGSNVNQIAKALNSPGDNPSQAAIEDALRTVTDIRSACMSALGRNP